MLYVVLKFSQQILSCPRLAEGSGRIIQILFILKYFTLQQKTLEYWYWLFGWLRLIILPVQIKKFNMPNVAFEGT